MAKRTTRNSVIDGLLRNGTEDNALILSEVLKQFPNADESAVRRQIYSRRFTLKSQVPA